MRQSRRHQFDPVDQPGLTDHVDVFTHAKWFTEDNRQASDDVAEHALRCQAKTDTEHAQTGDQRSDLDIEIVQSQKRAESQAQQKRKPAGQHTHGRLEAAGGQKLHGPEADPASGKKACQQKRQRLQPGPQINGAILDEKIDCFIFPFHNFPLIVILTSRRAKSNVQIALLGIFVLSGCRVAPVYRPVRFEFSKPQMGAPFRIVLYAPDAARAETAANAAFARVEGLNQIFSDYETDSELNALSRTAGSGEVVQVSDDLWRILLKAQRFAELSNGAFDVTVGPCVNLWRKARREKKLPDNNRLTEALRAVGYKKLVVKNKTSRLLC